MGFPGGGLLPASVENYDLTTYKAITPSDTQDLAPGTAITQAGGVTTLEFLRPLLSKNGALTPLAAQTHLLAWGKDNAFGKHKGRIPLTLTLAGCTAAVADPEAGSQGLEELNPAAGGAEGTASGTVVSC